MVTFESGFGKLEFDSNYLQYDTDNQASFEKLMHPVGKLFFGLFFKILYKSGALPKRSTGKIRVEQIDSVRFSITETGSKVTNAVLNNRVGAHITIVTASRGLGMYVEKGKVAEAEKFIDLLQASILDRGRKVELTQVAEEADTKLCPDCAETVKVAARICRYCNFQFDL